MIVHLYQQFHVTEIKITNERFPEAAHAINNADVLLLTTDLHVSPYPIRVIYRVIFVS
jgi:hypothetical protein